MYKSLNILKKTAAGTGGALLIGLLGGGLGLAQAVPSAPEAQTAGDGLVDVTVTANGQQIGVMQDVTLANAVSLATSVCPTSLIDLPGLTELDVNGTALANPCNAAMGLSFSFSQNAQGSAEVAPGQTGSPTAVPSIPPGQTGQQNG